MILPDRLYFPRLYTKMLLGSGSGALWSPGKMTLSGHDREQNWDVQNAKGQTGASSVHNGENVGQFQATYELMAQADIDAWPAFAELVASTTAGSDAIALPVYNALLLLNGYTAVSNGGIGGMTITDLGAHIVTVKFVELKPKQTKTSSAATGSALSAVGSGGASGAASNVKYDPNAERRAELAALQAKAAAL